MSAGVRRPSKPLALFTTLLLLHQCCILLGVMPSCSYSMCLSRRSVPSSSSRYEDNEDTLCRTTKAIMKLESSFAINHAAAIVFSSW